MTEGAHRPALCDEPCEGATLDDRLAAICVQVIPGGGLSAAPKRSAGRSPECGLGTAARRHLRASPALRDAGGARQPTFGLWADVENTVCQVSPFVSLRWRPATLRCTSPRLSTNPALPVRRKAMPPMPGAHHQYNIDIAAAVADAALARSAEEGLR